MRSRHTKACLAALAVLALVSLAWGPAGRSDGPRPLARSRNARRSAASDPSPPSGSPRQAFSNPYSTAAHPAATRPRTLVFIPVHTSEPPSALASFASCTFRYDPSVAGDGFDVLVAFSGEEVWVDEARVAHARDVLAAATAHLPHRPALHAAYVRLSDGSYTKDGEGVKPSFAGPNTVFYSALLADGAPGVPVGGPPAPGSGVVPDPGPPKPSPQSPSPASLYTHYTAAYAFLLQLETDVCALRAGWLDTALAPLLAKPHVLVAGSRLKVGEGGLAGRVGWDGGGWVALWRLASGSCLLPPLNHHR